MKQILTILFLLCALSANAQDKVVTGPKRKTLTSVSKPKQSQSSTSKSKTDKPVKISINTRQKVDLGLSVCWAGYNIGASSPEIYGNYYSWGEPSTKNFFVSTNCKTNNIGISNISGNSQFDAARTAWGGNWRIPTDNEVNELLVKCKWIRCSFNGADGYQVIGPNGNSIFFSMSGVKRGENYWEGVSGLYWTSSASKEGKACVLYMNYVTGQHDIDTYDVWAGLCIRPVCDK